MCTVVFLSSLLPLMIFGHDIYNNDVSIRVINDVLTFLKWEDTVLLYDRSLSGHDIQDMNSYLADHHVATITLSITDTRPEVIMSTISIIQNSSLSTLTVYLEPANTQTFLKYVRLTVMVYQHISKPFALHHIDLALRGWGVPGRCLKAYAQSLGASEATESDLFHHSYEWLVMATEEQVSTIQNLLTCTFCHIALLIDVADDSSSKTTHCSYENSTPTGINSTDTSQVMGTLPLEKFVICKYHTQTAIFEHVATWTSASKLKVFQDVIFPDFAQNFENRTLRIAIWESLPFTKRLSTKDGVVKYGGFCLVILNEMARFLNFTYELVQPPDGQYGAPYDNGSWNGMVGMLVRGEVDIAVGPFSITPERQVVVDFTVPFMEDGGGILTKGGDPGPDLLNLFRPFPLSVWLLMAGAVAVAAIALFAISKGNNVCCFLRQERPWSLQECLWVIYGSLVAQGACRHPQRSSGRMVLGCWWLFTILIVSTYTASLAALLTVRVHGHSVQSIQDLAQSSLDPLTIVGSSWWTLFMKAKTGVYSIIGQRMAEGPVVRVNDDAMALVYAGKGAFILDINQIRYLYSQDCKRLHIANTIFNNNGLGFALPKHAEYKEAINQVILKMQEGGFLEAWKREYWKTSSDCEHDEVPAVSGARQLQVVSIGGILIMYGCVILLCVLCLLLQCLLHGPCCQSLWKWVKSKYHGEEG